MHALALMSALVAMVGAVQDEDARLPHQRPPRVSFAPGPEHDADARKYQGIPGIERAANGRLWAVWYAGKVHEDRYNYVVGVTSADDGRTWSDLKFVIDPDGDGPVRASDPCLWLDPTGVLWLFWFQDAGGATLQQPALFAMTTDGPGDENPQWSEPRCICDGIMMCKPIVASNGDWLLPTAIWHRDESSRVVASADQGRTWALRGAAGVPNPDDRNCDESMMVERKDCSLWMLVRTMYGIGETTSHDGGATWAPVTPSDIPHPTSRFYLRRLASGALLLVKHGPLDERIGRTHLTAYLSQDDGRTWLGGLLLDERATVSYPDGTQGDDGTIYVIYDWNRADEKHILLATFTEADVLAGEAVSDKARLRVLVNEATGVNPKPWLRDGRFLNLRDNSDGAPPLDGPAAELAFDHGEAATVAPGEHIFTDRSYAFNVAPDMLVSKRFLRSSIDATEATCTAEGVVYALTPAPNRNPDSVAPALLEVGFEKVALPEHVLFLSPDGAAHGGNACTVYQKRVRPGERISFGKWGVLIY